jgi:chemotaxis protein histidine kinase CheA
MSFDSSQVDPAMLELFQAEMDTHIPVLNEGLLALEKGEAGGREIEGMMRAAHSIKGAARIVGIEQAVRVAHAMEDCFTAAKENRTALTSDAVDVLLVGVDALLRICSPSTGEPVAEAVLDDLLAGLAHLKVGSVPPRKSQPPQAARALATTIQAEEPCVTLPSSFGEETCQLLRGELLATLDSGAARVRLDFARVGELNASALALLASFVRQVGEARPAPAVEVCRVGPAVRTVLVAAGLADVLGMGR